MKPKHFFTVYRMLCAALLCTAPAVFSAETDRAPARIISLSPASTEILCAVGAGSQIAARSELCDYPEEITRHIPVAGGFDGKTVSIETLLSFRPDLVCLTAGMHDYLIPVLHTYRIRTFVFQSRTISEVCDEIRNIADSTGHHDGGVQCVAGIQAELAEVAALTAKKQSGGTKQPAVYWEIWHSPYMTAGAETFITDVVRTAGGTNIFCDIPAAYPVVSEESIIRRNPDIIIIPDDAAVTVRQITERRAWQQITAVASGAVYSIDADIISRPGPRLVQAVRILADCFYGGRE